MSSKKPAKTAGKGVTDGSPSEDKKDKSVRIEIRGTVGRDPELKPTNGGNVFTRVSIAADDIKTDGPKLDPVANKWQTVVLYGPDAEAAARDLKKGAQVQVAGNLETRQYTDKEGKERTVQEIHQGEVTVLRLAREHGPKVEIEGTVAKEVTLSKTTTTGKEFTRVTIAADKIQKDGAELDPRVNKWQTVVLWDEDARRAQSLQKGAVVRVAGEMVERSYVDRSGETKSLTEIQRASVEPLDRTKNLAPAPAMQNGAAPEMSGMKVGV